MATKPASRPIAKAVPHPSGRGFAGQFALPGLVPDFVRFQGQVVRYLGEVEARDGAYAALFRLLESRTTDTRKAGGYERITGAELATLLIDADISPTEFAEIYGVPQARVMKWIDGEQDIPHSANVLVRLLQIQENYEEAKALTRRAIAQGD